LGDAFLAQEPDVNWTRCSACAVEARDFGYPVERTIIVTAGLIESAPAKPAVIYVPYTSRSSIRGRGRVRVSRESRFSFGIGIGPESALGVGGKRIGGNPPASSCITPVARTWGNRGAYHSPLQNPHRRPGPPPPRSRTAFEERTEVSDRDARVKRLRSGTATQAGRRPSTGKQPQEERRDRR